MQNVIRHYYVLGIIMNIMDNIYQADPTAAIRAFPSLLWGVSIWSPLGVEGMLKWAWGGEKQGCFAVRWKINPDTS